MKYISAKHSGISGIRNLRKCKKKGKDEKTGRNISALIK